jgi:Adenine-specific DNA methylase containing a Zn-ribbon
MPRKKLIEVALPLEAINEASAREKSIRHGHPSTLHLWWARRPLATARAVIFASLVDDPDNPDAPPAFVEACKRLDAGANTRQGTELEFVIMVIAVSCVKLLSAHNSTQHTSRKHKV